jgi:hypothetical protein
MELLKEGNMTVIYGLRKIYEKWVTRNKKKGIWSFIDPEVLPFISPIHLMQNNIIKDMKLIINQSIRNRRRVSF